MDQGLKFNPIAAIDLERHVVEERPTGERFLEVAKRPALRKARSVPSFDARRNFSSHEQTSLHARIDIFFAIQGNGE